MKKILSLLGAIGLTATAAATVVACGNNEKVKSRYDQLLALNDAETKAAGEAVGKWVLEEKNATDIVAVGAAIAANKELPKDMSQERFDEIIDKQLELYTLTIKVADKTEIIDALKPTIQIYANKDSKLISAQHREWANKLLKYADSRIKEINDRDITKVIAF